MRKIIISILIAFVLAEEEGKPKEKLTNDVIESVPTSYQFRYSTGSEGPAQIFREEQRNNDGSVTGKYGYIDPNGKLRVVTYSAGVNGYSASGDIGPDPEVQKQAQLYHQGDQSIQMQQDIWNKMRTNNWGNWGSPQPQYNWNSVNPTWNAQPLPQPQTPSQSPAPESPAIQTAPLQPQPPSPSPPSPVLERQWDDGAQNQWENANPNTWKSNQNNNWNTWSNTDNTNWNKGGNGGQSWKSSVQHQWEQSQTSRGQQLSSGQWSLNNRNNIPKAEWPLQNSPNNGQWNPNQGNTGSEQRSGQWSQPTIPNPPQSPVLSQPLQSNQNPVNTFSQPEANQWSKPIIPNTPSQVWSEPPQTNLNNAQWDRPTKGALNINNQWPKAPGINDNPFSGSPFTYFSIEHSATQNSSPQRFQYSY